MYMHKESYTFIVLLTIQFNLEESYSFDYCWTTWL